MNVFVKLYQIMFWTIKETIKFKLLHVKKNPVAMYPLVAQKCCAKPVWLYFFSVEHKKCIIPTIFKICLEKDNHIGIFWMNYPFNFSTYYEHISPSAGEES